MTSDGTGELNTSENKKGNDIKEVVLNYLKAVSRCQKKGYQHCFRSGPPLSSHVLSVNSFHSPGVYYRRYPIPLPHTRAGL